MALLRLYFLSVNCTLTPIFTLPLFLLFPCFPKTASISSNNEEGPGEVIYLLPHFLSALPRERPCLQAVKSKFTVFYCHKNRNYRLISNSDLFILKKHSCPIRFCLTDIAAVGKRKAFFLLVKWVPFSKSFIRCLWSLHWLGHLNEDQMVPCL